MEQKRALCLLAEDAEEIEAIVTVDILRRAEIAVTFASITDNELVKCSRRVKICADTTIDNVKHQKYDVVILPGGAGWKHLAACKKVGEILNTHESENKIIAVICAAPKVLCLHGIAKGKKITGYPSIKEDVDYLYKYSDEKGVVIDGNLISAKGPAFTFEFALAIVEKLVGKERADTVCKALLYTRLYDFSNE